MSKEKQMNDEFATASTDYIAELIRIADKYGVDRDKYVNLNIHVLAITAGIGSFKEFKNKEEV